MLVTPPPYRAALVLPPPPHEAFLGTDFPDAGEGGRKYRHNLGRSVAVLGAWTPARAFMYY